MTGLNITLILQLMMVEKIWDEACMKMMVTIIILSRENILSPMATYMIQTET